jgi:hypothetical protein
MLTSEYGGFSLKNSVKLAVVLFALIAVSSMAFAATMPSQIIFDEQYQIVSFPVENTTSSNQYLKLDVYAPLNYDVVYMPEWIGPGESAEVKLKLTPIDGLTGSAYQSTFVFTLGAQVIENEVMLKFEKLNSNPFEITAVKTSGSTADKIYIEITAENRAMKNADLSLDRIENMPSDWVYKLQQNLGTFSQLQKKTVVLEIMPGSSYNGQLNLVFKNEFGEVSKNVGVNHEGTANPISGLFVLGSLPLTELAIDVLLIVIAIVLLVAFIARLVKHMNKKENEKNERC